jgi:protein gp37
MADKSNIEWLNGGSTWNFIDAINVETEKAGHFCEKIAPECKFCYAEKMNVNTYFGNGIRYAVDQRGKVRLELNECKLNKPLHWRAPRLVFPCSMTDLFGEWVPDSWIDAAYDVMDKASQHTFLILTKRPERHMKYLQKRYANRKPAPNIWEGVSAGLQETADKFIPLLLQTPAAVRWVSFEPLLGPVWTYGWSRNGKRDGISWAVAGGESGPGARPMHPDWARGLRDQCKAAGVPFFFKQWGEHVPQDQFSSDGWDDVAMNDTGVTIYPEGRITSAYGTTADGSERVWRVGKKAAGRKLDGKEYSEYPAEAHA